MKRFGEENFFQHVPRIHLIVGREGLQGRSFFRRRLRLVCENNVTEPIGCRACKMRKEIWRNELALFVWPLSIDWPERKCEKNIFTHQTRKRRLKNDRPCKPSRPTIECLRGEDFDSERKNFDLQNFFIGMDVAQRKKAQMKQSRNGGLVRHFGHENVRHAGMIDKSEEKFGKLKINQEWTKRKNVTWYSFPVIPHPRPLFVPEVSLEQSEKTKKIVKSSGVNTKVRSIVWSGHSSEGVLCENSQSLWHTHETQCPSTSIAPSHMSQLLTAFSLRLSSAGPQKCDFCKSHPRREYKVVHSLWHTHETQDPSTSIAPSHMSQLLTAFSLRLSSTGPQKSDFCKSHPRREYAVVHSLWHTHETEGPKLCIARSQMPQLLTVFPFRLSSAGPQKCDFCKSRSRREYAVVHSFWNVKVWQSGVRYHH